MDTMVEVSTTDSASGDDRGEDKPAASAAPGGSSDWRQGISDPKVRQYAERFATAEDAAASALEMRQKMSSAISLPGNNASLEEIAEYRARMGIPDTVDGYKFEMPEGYEASDADVAFQGRMAGIFHETGISSAQAVKLNKAWNELVLDAHQASSASENDSIERADQDLRSQWGAGYKSNLALAHRAYDAFGSPEFTKMLKSTNVGGVQLIDHPEMVKAFAAAGRQMMEDTMHGKAGGVATSSIKDWIDEIHSWQFAANPNLQTKYQSDTTQGELRSLYTRIHGEKPIVGGRTV